VKSSSAFILTPGRRKSSYPEHRNIFPLFHRPDFAVFGNKGCRKTFGGSAGDSVRKGYAIEALQPGGFPIDKAADSFDDLKGKLVNVPHHFVRLLHRSVFFDKVVIHLHQIDDAYKDKNIFGIGAFKERFYFLEPPAPYSDKL
jgi:hypothetical protein